MGLFEHFPYSNFHEMNLDWLLQKTKELADSVSSVEELVAALKAEVKDFFDNLDLQEEVNNKIDEMAAAGFFDDILTPMFNAYKERANALIKAYAREIVGDVKLNLYTKGYNVNGGCYIGNNRFAIYFASTSSDTGLLRIYDASLYTVLEEAQILGYHGNSMTCKDGYLYICACYSVANTAVLIPNIVVVDVNDISQVASVLLPPLPGVYSLAWDDDTQAFYAIAYRGTTPGEANRLYKLSADLSKVLSYIDLEDYPALYARSMQGVQCVHDGVAYSIDYTNRAISAFNINNGKKIFDGPVETRMNGYRKVGELEFLTVDDNDEFYLGFSTENVGEYGATGGTMAHIGLYHSIPHRLFRPSGLSIGAAAAATPVVTLNFLRVIKPTDSDGVAYMLGDALNLLNETEMSGEIRVVASLPDDWDGAAFTLDGYNGLIIGLSSASKIPTRFVKAYGCRFAVWNLKFIDQSQAVYLNGGYTADAAICLFESVFSEASCDFIGTIKGIDGMFYDATVISLDIGSASFKGLRSIMRAATGVTLPGFMAADGNNTIIRTGVDHT